MRVVKLAYVVSSYMSHNRVGGVYREVLQSRYPLVRLHEQPDIVILHLDPSNYGSVFSSYKELANKYVIAYCVWEANDIPDVHKRFISRVNEVWTCSQYCCEVFSRYHPTVIHVPHATERDVTYDERDLDLARKMMRYENECFYYMMISKVWDKRKNVIGLVTAFQKQKRLMPKARLVIKATARDSVLAVNDPRIIFIHDQLTHSQINALYSLTDVYISPHHSEGWGLTLSDAMIFKKPVIATGYSGNLDFMDKENSFLLDFEEAQIRPKDCYDLFSSQMKWAYPIEKDLESKLLFLYESCESRIVREKIDKASKDVKRFNREYVAHILHQRVAEIIATRF